MFVLCSHPADMEDWYRMVTKMRQPKMRLGIDHLQVRTSQHLLYILKTAYHILLLLQNEASDYSRLSEVMSNHTTQIKNKSFAGARCQK